MSKPDAPSNVLPFTLGLGRPRGETSKAFRRSRPVLGATSPKDFVCGLNRDMLYPEMLADPVFQLYLQMWAYTWRSEKGKTSYQRGLAKLYSTGMLVCTWVGQVLVAKRTGMSLKQTQRLVHEMLARGWIQAHRTSSKRQAPTVFVLGRITPRGDEHLFFGEFAQAEIEKRRAARVAAEPQDEGDDGNWFDTGR